MGGRRVDLPPLPSLDGGVAGRSAKREHERRAKRRELTLRARFPIVGGFLHEVLPEPQSTRAWSSGSAGESAIGRRLDSMQKAGVLAIHDRRIPRSVSNIDHIAVGRSGVFVIDTKRYQGARVKKVYLGPIWNPGPAQLMVHGRNCTNLVSKTLRQGEAVSCALDGLPGSERVPISRMLVFVDGDWGRFAPAFEVDGAWIGPPNQMAKLLRRDGPLDPKTVRLIAETLAKNLKPA